jgi:uncharacterized damage-inducible protein DinB
MRRKQIVWLPALLVAAAALGQPQPQAPATATVASVVDLQVTAVEKMVGDAAEAMPEDRFGFSPESLSIGGSNYKGVRTFGQQVLHIAASNYILLAPVTGEKFPPDFLGGNGPAGLKTKAEILKFLRDSFALGHRAVAALTAQNMLEPPAGGKRPRLHLVTFSVAHAYDHYGQMVEYLRMSGIVPPASRGNTN